MPEDIAVVGLDDIELAARGRVPLTTVRQPTDRIGARAVDTVLARLRGERPETRQFLAPELIVRRSCGAPSAARTADPRAAPRHRRPRSLADRARRPRGRRDGRRPMSPRCRLTPLSHPRRPVAPSVLPPVRRTIP